MFLHTDNNNYNYNIKQKWSHHHVDTVVHGRGSHVHSICARVISDAMETEVFSSVMVTPVVAAPCY